MTNGQHLALGLVVLAVGLTWIIPQAGETPKLFRIIQSAFTAKAASVNPIAIGPTTTGGAYVAPDGSVYDTGGTTTGPLGPLGPLGPTLGPVGPYGPLVNA